MASSSKNHLLVVFSSIFSILITTKIVHGAYSEQYLDSMGCNSKKISLSNFPNNTFVLKLSRWEDYHLPSAFMNFQCKFQVVAPLGHGIMVVTQGLHLRTKSKQSHRCRDYIKFEQTDGRESGPICGEVNASDHAFNPKTLNGPRTFYDPNGVLDVFFSADESASSEVQKPMFLHLVFTTYSECTSTELITHRIRSCSDGRMNACIASNLFCDGIINCGFKGDFAFDEKDCGRPDIKKLDDEPIVLFDNNNINIKDSKDKSSRVNGYGDGGADNFVLSSSLPVHVFALISAATGGLLVLLFIFFCCCIGRFGRLSPRNTQLRHDNPEGTVQLGVVPNSSVQMGPVIMSRMTPSQKLVKPREDLPPPYEAIFPHPKQPEKK